MSCHRILPVLVLAATLGCTPEPLEATEAGGENQLGGDGDQAGGSAGSGGTSSGGNSGGGAKAAPGPLGEGNQCSDCPQLGDANDRGQVLVFSDDFVGGELDRSVWTQEMGMVRNKEEQCYLDRDENIIVQDGMLTIRALAEAVDDPLCVRDWNDGEGEIQGAYSSAAITTKDRGVFTYGYIEARIKVPSATGTWPAFWMRPQERVYGSWPTSGEIDVMEHVSQEPNVVHGTVHYDFFGHEYDGNQLELESPLHAEFHTYAINWDEDRIDWYFDDEHFHTFDLSNEIQGRRPFNESFYLLLNLAVGGHWPESPAPDEYPAEMLVDWVRVWQSPR